MAIDQYQGGYSASVEIRLAVNGETFEVAQVGRDSLILRNPQNDNVFDGENARLIIVVDGHETVYDILLLPHTADRAARSISFF